MTKSTRFPIRATIQGAYGVGNFGDDLLMVSSIALHRAFLADFELAIFTRDPSYLPQLAPSVRKLDWRSLRDVVPDALHVYGGGGLFYAGPRTRHIWWRTWSRRLLAAYNPWRTWRFWHRRRLERRWNTGIGAAIGIGIGPFDTDTIEETATQQRLRRLAFLAVRDPISASFCQRWGIETALLGADLAYCSDLWDGPPDASLPVRAHHDPPRIGLIVRDPLDEPVGTSYFEAVLYVADILAKRGMDVRFVLLAPTFDRFWRHRLREHQWASLVTWQPMRQTVGQFARELATFDVVVSARYHGLVCAALYDTPVIAIEIEEKLRAGANEWNRPCWSTPFASADLIALVTDALDNRAEIIVRQRSAGKLLRERSRHMVRAYHGFLSERLGWAHRQAGEEAISS